MTKRAPRALIVGAGLAGPCLANGLRHAGWDVALFERDPGPASRGQGCRIHLAPEGGLALRACLPPHLYELAVATPGRPAGPGAAITLSPPTSGPSAASRWASYQAATARAVT